MTFLVKADAMPKINLAPSSLVEEIAQNIRMILSTLKGTVPLDREFGLSSSFIDKPTPIAEAMIVSVVLDAVEQYEPRAEILNVSFERDEGTGKLIPCLEVEINAG